MTSQNFKNVWEKLQNKSKSQKGIYDIKKSILFILKAPKNKEEKHKGLSENG